MHARGFRFSDGLEEETGFVWDGSHLLQEIQPDGRYTYLYTNPNSYEPLAQVRNWTTEDGESRQQTHYFHCDQIGIPREMTDKDSNLFCPRELFCSRIRCTFCKRKCQSI